MLVAQSRRSTWFPYSQRSACSSRSRPNRLRILCNPSSFDFISNISPDFCFHHHPTSFIRFRNGINAQHELRRNESYSRTILVIPTILGYNSAALSRHVKASIFHFLQAFYWTARKSSMIMKQTASESRKTKLSNHPQTRKEKLLMTLK